MSLSLLLRVCSILGISTDDILLPDRSKNDVADLSERLQNLPQHQFTLIRDIVYKLLETFSIKEKTDFFG